MIVVVTRIREKKKREKEILIILRTQSTSLNSEEIHSTQNVLIDIQFTSPVIPIRCNYRSLRSLATLRSTVPSSLSLSFSRSRSGQATLTKKLISARALRAGRRRNAAYREANLSTKT